MHFTLLQFGKIPSGNSKTKNAVDQLRLDLSPQIRNVYDCQPLARLSPVIEHTDDRWDAPAEVPHAGHAFSGDVQLGHEAAGWTYSALVGDRLGLACRLRITFFEKEGSMSVSTQVGDLDNKAKSLLDALRLPQTPPKQSPTDETVHCLLEDDTFVWGVDLRHARLLHADRDAWETLTQIDVEVIAKEATFTNQNLLGVPVT